MLSAAIEPEHPPVEAHLLPETLLAEVDEVPGSWHCDPAVRAGTRQGCRRQDCQKREQRSCHRAAP